MKPLVSTIIPVHNRSALLEEAAASVLGQTHRPIEIIIVDDGSTDDTAAVARALALRHPDEIRTLRQQNGGPGSARETGRQVAAGEFIQYLDSDDILLPTKFERQVAGLAKHSECGVAYGNTHHCERGSTSQRRPWKRTGERIETMFPSFLQSRWWGTSTPLYRRTVTDAAGPWLGLSNEEDWEYDCRVASGGVRLFFTDEFVSEEHEHPGARLSRGGSVEPEKLRDRATAHLLILQHARRAGIGAETPEMKHFSRELFLLSRLCGAAGLGETSHELFDLAVAAADAQRAEGYDFRLYRMIARILGWATAGRMTTALDRLRS